MEMQCTEPTLLTCHGLEKVDQHLLGDMLTQHEALDHGMVIVETCINSSVLYLCFKIFRAAECVRVRRVEDCTAHSEVHLRSLEIAFQDSRNRTRKTPVSGGIFRVIRSGAKGHPRRVGNSAGISVYAAVLNSCHRPPETEVVLRVHAADKGVGNGGPHHGKKA